MTNIASKLKNMRIKHGFSQEKLAEQLMVSRQAVSKWENGESLPDMENMIALAKLYGTSLDELVGITSNTDDIVKGEAAQSEITEETEDVRKYKRGGSIGKILGTVSYPIVVTVIYLLIGSLTHSWHIAWILYVTIPLYYSIVACVNQKRFAPFNYPVFVTCIFLYFGMQFGFWHPLWVIFLTIPIYYEIASEIDKSIAKKRRKK